MQLVPATLWCKLSLTFFTLSSLCSSTLCCFSFIPFHLLSFKLSLHPPLLLLCVSACWCLWELVVWLNRIANATADMTPPNSLTYFSFWAAFIWQDIFLHCPLWNSSPLSLFHSSLPIPLSVAYTFAVILYHCCTSAPRLPVLFALGMHFHISLIHFRSLFCFQLSVRRKISQCWQQTLKIFSCLCYYETDLTG